MLDPMTSLAFAVYSGKGVHALLLGSGLSIPSGIPTGWDVVLGLIRRIAKVQEQDCEPDPAAWYRTTFGKNPDYSEILEMVAPEPAERMTLLKGYFEQTPEEREERKKEPTAAHHAIAKLVADGYIRVIVTTNFDKLMERALDVAGVVPQVISSTDGILGAQPISQARCTIIKVHGDYLDTRSKNTPTEVGEYDGALNMLLDQVFDEYGLIVCGWSADWDGALRSAITRCPNRRYTMYWSAFRQPSPIAAELCQSRRAQVIPGMGADTFFGKLVEKVGALKDMDAPHPLSAQMAVELLKKYLVDEKYDIKLHDLVMGETRRVATILFTRPGLQGRNVSLKYYEAQLAILMPLMTAAGYWGKPRHRALWLRCFQQMVTPPTGNFAGFPVDTDYYPAYLLLHAYGIASLAAGRTGNLGYILSKGTARSENGGQEPLIRRVVIALRDGSFDNSVKREDETLTHAGLEVSEYLSKILTETLKPWIPEESRYNEFFCQFEYIIGLVISSIMEKEMPEFFHAMSGIYLAKRNLPKLFQDQIDRRQENWPLLKAGLFDGSKERLLATKNGFDQAGVRLKRQIGYW